MSRLRVHKGIDRRRETSFLTLWQATLLCCTGSTPAKSSKTFTSGQTGFKVTMMQPQGAHFILHNLINVTDDIARYVRLRISVLPPAANVNLSIETKDRTNSHKSLRIYLSRLIFRHIPLALFNSIIIVLYFDLLFQNFMHLKTKISIC